MGYPSKPKTLCFLVLLLKPIEPHIESVRSLQKEGLWASLGSVWPDFTGFCATPSWPNSTAAAEVWCRLYLNQSEPFCVGSYYEAIYNKNIYIYIYIHMLVRTLQNRGFGLVKVVTHGRTPATTVSICRRLTGTPFRQEVLPCKIRV